MNSLHMADFESIVRAVRCEHRLRVRKWRTSMSGSAWQVLYTDGRVTRWIESPFPRTNLSLAIFLHEVGHHVIGFDRYKHRCDEEFHAWKWALDELRRLKIPVDQKVARRFHASMQYAVGKALRRGMKQLPEHLKEFKPKAA